MANIKENFEDFRSNTPKHIQWLLLGVAFLIVVILLTLLLTNKSSNEKSVKEVNKQIDLTFNPSHIEFKDVKVGDSANKSIDVSASAQIIIDSVKIPLDGFKTPNDCSYGLTDSCTIKVIYLPTKVQNNSQTSLTITWHAEGQEDMIHTAEIPVMFNSYKEPEPVIELEPEPEEPEFVDDEFEEIFDDEPEPEPEPELEFVDDEYEEVFDEEPEPVQEIKQIAVPNPIKQEPEIKPVVPPKQCSEFAIPGYDTSGRQIGWIKPERGANYFYPLTDKDCSNPTGKYDMTTGIITSLKDGTKIGTDSDHIGYRNVRERNLKVPKLSMPNLSGSQIARSNSGQWGDDAQWSSNTSNDNKKFNRDEKDLPEEEKLMGSAKVGEYVTSSMPYDRTFILRQFKPIPATIVSEVRADPSVYGCNKAGQNCDSKKNYSVPVRATVDRNVYSDDGRTIILPTGTLLLGYLDGKLPGPYQAFGRMNIKWYQFIRPDGVEFNFEKSEQDPYSGDAQGRMGVPGHGSTDYIEQMVMPILTALVPAAVNMIAPITDTVINQIDLDNNTIVQSGTIRSSEMAKQDIINTWNKITQKLLVDAIDNTVPPFSIAAGTRINVFSPVDLIVSCYDLKDKKCSVIEYGENKRRKWSELNEVSFAAATDPSWVGQIRSFNLTRYCEERNGKVTIRNDGSWQDSGYDYRTVLAYCEAQNYQAINNAKQATYNKQVQTQAQEKRDDYGVSWNADDGWTTNFGGDAEAEQKYNEEVLGLTYDDKGNIINPFAKSVPVVADQDILTCDGGEAPDENGCCAGETFTDMGDAGWNCCPDSGGDCFPPITVE